MSREIETMQALRDAGWLVVLKAMPEEFSHIIEGSRSEYDAPCDDTKIGKGKWSCEAEWLGEKLILGPWALGDTPEEALLKVDLECRELMRKHDIPLPAKKPTVSCRRCGRVMDIPDDYEDLPEDVKERRMCTQCAHALKFNTGLG